MENHEHSAQTVRVISNNVNNIHATDKYATILVN